MALPLQWSPHAMPRMKIAACALLTLGACGSETTAPTMPPPPACAGPGSICTWAGNGLPAFNGDGRPAADTSFYWPIDLDFAPDGTPYVLDWNNHRVRTLDTNGTFRTVIGNDLPGDGPPDMSDMKPEGALGTDVELNHPTDLAFLPDGQVLVAA